MRLATRACASHMVWLGWVGMAAPRGGVHMRNCCADGFDAVQGSLQRGHASLLLLQRSAYLAFADTALRLTCICIPDTQVEDILLHWTQIRDDFTLPSAYMQQVCGYSQSCPLWCLCLYLKQPCSQCELLHVLSRKCQVAMAACSCVSSFVVCRYHNGAHAAAPPVMAWMAHQKESKVVSSSALHSCVRFEGSSRANANGLVLDVCRRTTQSAKLTAL